MLARMVAPPDVTANGPRGVVVRLITASALMLFLELALIRWLGANIVHLSYFSNFVLLGSFLGIGAGFLIARKRWSLARVSPVLLALLVVGVVRFPVTIDRTGDSLVYFTSLTTAGPPAWLVLPIVFVVVAVTLAGPAEIVGRCFGHLEPLVAYRWDLVGSVIGISGFTLLSFLRAPSVVWGVLASLAYLGLAIRDVRRPAASAVHLVVTALAATAVVATLLVETLTPGVSWSPYYKVQGAEAGRTPEGELVYLITVNGVPHQLMGPAQWKLTEGEAQYGTPYERRADAPLTDVLIIGAGSGSDVSIALSEGAAHVDAVDIDPRIMEIGAELNPDYVYQQPEVTQHVDDGRAFLRSTDKQYDLILFALPDSLALVHGASQIRLESFLFTQEALASARDHLKPGGTFSMYNYYREDWLIDRLGGTARSAFGHDPCIDLLGGGQAVVTIAKDPAQQRCATENHTLPADVIAPATDDAPFLYYRGDGIPPVYLWTLAGILLISALAIRGLGGSFASMRPYVDLFCMGAAFLLLETKNIATFALLFGTTWLVNAFVFGGVLLVVLAAVETTRRVRTPPLPVVFGAIAASLVVAYLVPPELLLSLPYVPRLVAAILLAFVPIFLANVAFAKRFAASDESRAAFGLNLLGSIVGGCLEYAALLTGYRNLLILVGVLYLIAFVLAPRRAGQIVAT